MVEDFSELLSLVGCLAQITLTKRVLAFLVENKSRQEAFLEPIILAREDYLEDKQLARLVSQQEEFLPNHKDRKLELVLLEL